MPWARVILEIVENLLTTGGEDVGIRRGASVSCATEIHFEILDVFRRVLGRKLRQAVACSIGGS